MSDGDIESCVEKLLELARAKPLQLSPICFLTPLSRLGKAIAPQTRSHCMTNFASHLWTNCGWSNELKEKGMTWQTFREIIDSYEGDVEDYYVRRNIVWDELIKKIADKVCTEPLQQKVRLLELP